MTRRIPIRTAWSVAALVFVSMVGGTYLWQGPRAALMVGVGHLIVFVGVLVTWSRAGALPASAPRGRSDDGHRRKGDGRVDGS